MYLYFVVSFNTDTYWKSTELPVPRNIAVANLAKANDRLSWYRDFQYKDNIYIGKMVSLPYTPTPSPAHPTQTPTLITKMKA